MTTNEQRSQALSAAGEHRVELKEAVSKAERAAASPTAMPSWRDYVLRELEGLRIALDQHVEEVEGTDGLFAELTELSPRLIHKIHAVRDEHPVLCQGVGDAIELANSDAPAAAVRQAVLDVLFLIVRHRQHGADLVFDGYNVDIGGGG